MATRAADADQRQGKDPIFDPLGGVEIRDIGNSCILFSEGQQRVYKLDALSASVWRDLSLGHDRDLVVKRIANGHGCTPGEAALYVSHCLHQWQEQGLLGLGAGRLDRKDTTETQTLTRKTADGEVYSCAGVRIAILFPDRASLEAWNAIAGHLLEKDAGDAEDQVIVEASGKAYRIAMPRDTGLRGSDPAAIAVCLKELVLRRVLERRPAWIALHAAALASPDHTMSFLLPGRSGSGKTTLAAALNALGMNLIAEDAVFLSSRSGETRGFPFAFAAKPGSEETLQSWFPQLPEIPEIRRPDGRRVRYLKPVRTCGTAPRISTVVFPQFTPARGLRVTEFEKADALVALIREALNARRWLTGSSFAALCRMLDEARVMQLEYDDAATAAQWLLERKEDTTVAS